MNKELNMVKNTYNLAVKESENGVHIFVNGDFIVSVALGTGQPDLMLSNSTDFTFEKVRGTELWNYRLDQKKIQRLIQVSQALETLKEVLP